MEDVILPWRDSSRGVPNGWKRDLEVNIALRNRQYSQPYWDVNTCFFVERDKTVKRLGPYKTLERHVASVNTLQFNDNGFYLMSGSDDRRCILWHWQAGRSYAIDTGHTNDILNVQFMPCSNDNRIVTGAADGQVRFVDLSVGATLRVLAKELGKVHKMAVVPENPNTLYSCSGNGFVTHFDVRTKDPTLHFSVNQGTSHIVGLYDIANDPTNASLSALAGSDITTRIFDIRMCHVVNRVSPTQLPVSARGISSLAYSNTGELLASYRHSDIYLFSKEVVNSVSSRSDINAQQVYKGHRNEIDETVQRISFLGPHCEYVVSGSDSGHAIIWRKRDGQMLRAIQGNSYLLNCVEPHPQVPVLATGGADNYIKLFSARDIIQPDNYNNEIASTIEEIDMEDRDADYTNARFNTFVDEVSFNEFNNDDDSDDSNGSDDDNNTNSDGDMNVDTDEEMDGSSG